MAEFDEQLVFEMGYNQGFKNGIKGSVPKSVLSRCPAVTINYITQHINSIVWCYRTSPVFDQLFIHGVNTLKGPITHLNNVDVPKVRITYIEVHKITFDSLAVSLHRDRSHLETHETIET